MIVAGVALISTALAAAPALADVKAGVDAWARGDFKAAVEQWRGPAVAGDADAQFNLGQAYKLGRGVPVDPALAESWFRKAAVQGHLQAQDNYALALFQSGRKAEAVPYLEKSIVRGEPRTQLVYGTMLFNGDGVPRDYPRAYALMTLASQKGLKSAGETLAQMDQYISAPDRERGTRLAAQYDAQARALATRTTDQRTSSVTESRPVPGKAAASAAPRPTPGRAIATTAVPASRPAATPAVATPMRGNWRIQLGAFRDRGNAEALWTRVRSRVPGAQPAYVAGGGVIRLQATGFPSKAAATRACAASGTPCVLVAP
jgi:hypothetical protein